jgi:hypothetical protein
MSCFTVAPRMLPHLFYNRKLDLLTKETGNTKTHKGNTQTENNGLINLTRQTGKIS